jgi:hypothetical protein
MEGARLVTTVTRQVCRPIAGTVQQCDGLRVRDLKRCGPGAARAGGFRP